jgi:glycosyltransferase involved in cell wall biosynthesis
MMPYGSDIAIISELEEMDREAWLTDYPLAAERDRIVKKQVLYFVKRADFVIGCGSQISGYQPRQDLLLFSYLAIDTNRWRADGIYSTADGHTGEVLILHTPNHRSLKGTDYLIHAVKQLQVEGLQIKLEILEGRSNEEVKASLIKADILAEQFLGGYTLSAIEGMSLGKPVLSNLSRHPKSLRDKTPLCECPVLNTPVDRIKENLELLVTHPELRRELGLAGRRYVEKYHSLEAMGQILDKVYHKVWIGEASYFNY